MQKIGILTSGGDAPGMNAAIRAVVRSAKGLDMQVIGFTAGYEGLMDNVFRELSVEEVGGILQRGGTILETSRSDRFMQPEGQRAAVKTLEEHDISALIAIGGDGTYRGALDLAKLGVNVIGIPGTIDNDMGYTDYTIGFDTAVNTVVDAIAKIKDTTISHNKTSIIEVMGRKCGDIALFSGLTGGAECIMIPELAIDKDAIAEKIMDGAKRGKHHNIIIKAEGVDMSNEDLSLFVKGLTGDSPRVTVLGYLQRGGSPTVQDRLLATKLGVAACEAIKRGDVNVAVGVTGGDIITTPMEKAAAEKRQPDLEMMALMYDLA